MDANHLVFETNKGNPESYSVRRKMAYLPVGFVFRGSFHINITATLELNELKLIVEFMESDEYKKLNQ